MGILTGELPVRCLEAEDPASPSPQLLLGSAPEGLTKGASPTAEPPATGPAV